MNQQKQKPGLGKKLLIGIGILVILGWLGSKLGGDDASSAAARTGESSSAGNESGTAEEYKKVGDQIEVGNFSYIVNSVRFAKTVGSDFAKRTADGIYVIINVTFKNNDNEEHTLDNSFFKLTDEKGTEFSSSSEGETALDMSDQETLFLKQCNPHITKSGFLIFEVPEKKVYDLHLSGGFWNGHTAIVKLTTQ